MSKKHPVAVPDSDLIATIKVRFVEIVCLVVFVVITTDVVVSEITPIIKHIWQTLH